MTIYPFQAVYPNLDFITSAEAFFGSVKNDFVEYKKSGFFTKAAQEAIYLHQIESPNRTYNSIVACVDIQDYHEGNILKHENTLSTKEQQQMRLMLSRNASVKPVLLTYPPVQKINKLVQSLMKEETPFLYIHFKSIDECHRIWQISQGEHVENICQLFDRVPKTYIADGHHRTSTTALLNERMKQDASKEYDRLLVSLFPTSELDVFDYNRIIEDFNELSPTFFMAKISQLFDISILKKPSKPRRKHELVMYLFKEWYRLEWKSEILQKYKDEEVVLDASLLDEWVLQKILGIEDVRIDERITYIEGPRGLDEIRQKTNKGDMEKVAFLLYPVNITDLLKIADAHKIMPPKSTWFQPRLKNGILVKEF